MKTKKHILKKWLDSQKDLSCTSFAKRLDIRPDYLSQIMSGYRNPSKFLCLKIQVETNGEVKAENLRDMSMEDKQIILLNLE